MEDLNKSILVNLVFDSALKPELAGSKRPFACAECVKWHHKDIYFLVPRHMKTLQDLSEDIRSNHGIQSEIILCTKGTLLPLDLPRKVLTCFDSPINVLPIGPIVKVVPPKCNCAATAAQAVERMICQFGDANIDEVSATLTELSSSSALTAEKSGTMKRAAGVSHLDEIELDQRDVIGESSGSPSTSKGVELGSASDEIPTNVSDEQTTPTVVDNDSPELTTASSVTTSGSKVYDGDNESTEKSTEDLYAMSVESSQEKESPKEKGEEPNVNKGFVQTPSEGQVSSVEPTGSSWTTVTTSSNDQCEKIDENHVETQIDTGSLSVDYSSKYASGDAAMESSNGLQDGAGAEMAETQTEGEASSESITTVSVDMIDNSAGSSTNTTSGAKRPMSMSAHEFGRVLKKPKIMTDSAKQIFFRTFFSSTLNKNVTRNLEKGGLSRENFPLTSTPNSTVDFSGAYEEGQREAWGARCSNIEKTEDYEMETFTETETD